MASAQRSQTLLEAITHYDLGFVQHFKFVIGDNGFIILDRKHLYKIAYVGRKYVQMYKKCLPKYKARFIQL